MAETVFTKNSEQSSPIACKKTPKYKVTDSFKTHSLSY